MQFQIRAGMTRLQIQETFSAQLRLRLQQRFRGRLPSAATLATHFNCRVSETTSGISNETARRWLRGECIPDKWRMRVLVKWLGIDLQKALSLHETHCDLALLQLDETHREVLNLFSRLNESQKVGFLNLLRINSAVDARVA
jgi:hypothetical protein